MDPSVSTWLGLVIFGLVFGLFTGPALLFRIGIVLMMMLGLGLLFSSTSGYDRMAWWFGFGMAAIAVAFTVALAGAVVGGFLRKLVHRMTHKGDSGETLRKGDRLPNLNAL